MNSTIEPLPGLFDGPMAAAATTYWSAAARSQLEPCAPSVDDRSLLTVKQAAARLNLTDRTVRNLIDRGELPTVKIPGTTNRRIEPAAVDDLIRRGRESR